MSGSVQCSSQQVGLAAMQICKSLGLKILVTAGTETGLALAKQHGADVAVNHREKGYEDIILVSIMFIVGIFIVRCSVLFLSLSTGVHYCGYLYRKILIAKMPSLATLSCACLHWQTSLLKCDDATSNLSYR